MRFICDEMLGKLARWLRVLGFDTRYYKKIDDRQLLTWALTEDRWILTRDQHLSAMRLANKAYLVTGDEPLEQLRQVVTHFSLQIEDSRLFTRCLECNVILNAVDRETIRERLWPFIYQSQPNFRVCPECNRIFWPGTHVERMQKSLQSILPVSGSRNSAGGVSGLWKLF